MTERLMKPIRIAALAATGALVAATGASAADFYKGKNVTYVVATGAGGGYDFYGRLLSKYMEKYLPGSTFVVRNVPGAGHIIGANMIANAKPDGLTIGTFNTGLIFAQILERKGVRFDLAKMTWIGKAASDPRVLVLAQQSKIQSIEDLKTVKTPVRFASAGVGSSAYNDTLMLSKVLGWNINLITGYRGADSELAMRRGEIEANVSSLSSAELFVNNGYGRYLFQIGGKSENNTPLLSDLVEDKSAKAIAALIGSQAELARFTAGPGGIPADRTEVLRAAYKKSLEDKELIEHAKKADRPIDPLYGEEVAMKVREALDQPSEVIALVSEILNIKPPSSKTTTTLASVSPDGREIVFKHGDKEIKSKVSGSRTKITVGGKPAKRDTLKAGMSCAIDYKAGGENEPKTIDCQ